MQCLLRVLRGEAGAQVSDLVEWEDAVALAEEHHVLPFVAETLLQSGITLAPAINALLAHARREALHYSFLQSSEQRHLLQAFAQSSIAVVPLKGPFLAQRIYGAASMRLSCDHDLLVHRTDFASATLLLERLGFAAETLPDDYHQKWSRGTTIVELHFDVENPLAIDFDVPSAWTQVCRSEFAGVSVLHFTPHDELRYLCLHGVRHRFGRLSYLLDIVMAAKHLDHSQDPSPTEAGLVDNASNVLMLGCAMARKLHPEGVHPPPPSHSARLERLADNLWSDLLTEAPIQQDWTSMHRFYLQLEPDLPRRLRRQFLHLCILLTRLIDDDFRFAMRFGLQRPWQAWILRPVRLALRIRTSHKADSIW